MHQVVFELGRNVAQSEFERMICGHPHEVVCAYDADGRQLFAPLEGEEDRVALPPRVEVDLRGATLVHNHPKFRTLSKQDIETGAQRAIGAVVVVLPDQTVLRLRIVDPNNWPFEELMDRNYEAWMRMPESLRMNVTESEETTVARHRAVLEQQRLLFAQIGVELNHDRIAP